MVMAGWLSEKVVKVSDFLAGGVTWDENSHHFASSFDTEGKWRDIEKENILDSFRDVALDDGGLNSGAISDGLIGCLPLKNS